MGAGFVRSKEKVILALVSVFILAVAAALLVVALPLIPLESIRTGLAALYGNVFLAVAGVLLLLLSLLVFSRAFKREKDGKYVSQGGSQGEIRISFAAIENMVLQVARGSGEAGEIKTKIKGSESGLKILLKINVLPETVIPEITEKLQESIKEKIQEIAGVTVSEVKVMVESVTAKGSG